MDNPERYKISARILSFIGFPCGVSRVNWNPHFLHLYRCTPVTNPFFTNTSEPHLRQCISPPFFLFKGIAKNQKIVIIKVNVSCRMLPSSPTVAFTIRSRPNISSQPGRLILSASAVLCWLIPIMWTRSDATASKISAPACAATTVRRGRHAPLWPDAACAAR